MFKRSVEIAEALIARACGAEGIRVQHADELGDALAQALASGRPTLVEVATDPDAYPPIVGWDDEAVFATGHAGA